MPDNGGRYRAGSSKSGVAVRGWRLGTRGFDRRHAEIAALKRTRAESPRITGARRTDALVYNRHARPGMPAGAELDTRGVRAAGNQGGVRRRRRTEPRARHLQPQRLADILPAMTKAPCGAARRDRPRQQGGIREDVRWLPAAAPAVQAAGNDFLVIEPAKAPLLDNLRVAPPRKIA